MFWRTSKHRSVSTEQKTTRNVFYGDLTVKSNGTSGSTLHHPHSIEEAIAQRARDDPRWSLVQRVLESEHFRGSNRLREFLLYIAECAIRDAPEDTTEQQIGINVFARAPGYNCSEDSIVRTHARTLRQKLATYFATEGLDEPTVIEVPKGHYLPIFHPRPVAEKAGLIGASPLSKTFPAVEPPAEQIRSRKLFRRGGTIVAAIMAIVLFLVSGILIGYTLERRATEPRSAVDALWAPFFAGNPPLVIYSNELFLGDSKTGLRYPPADMRFDQPPEHSVDHYTGIGEVAAVFELTKLFDSRRSSFILKRSLLVAWDEAKLRNLIFIGSTAENPSLRVLPTTTDFTIMSGPDYAGVINHHPAPGEPALFSRPEHPLTKDYAIIALLPAVEPGRQMLILSGLTTLGTQAAVEFVCRPESVTELLKAGSFPKDHIRPFEAVLEVTLGGGVPLQTKLISIRTH
jgi:hypothetical protein